MRIVNPRLAALRAAVDAGKARQQSWLPESPVVRRVVVKAAVVAHAHQSSTGGAA